MKKQSTLLFARVLGPRAFWGFVLITILAAGILAATNIVSKYAIKLYVEDQLKHVPWDIVGYQSDDLARFRDLSGTLSGIHGIQRAESLGLLRVQLNPQIPIEIDGQRVHLLWFSIMSATDLTVLPPSLRPEAGQPILALLGPQKIIKPYLDQVSSGSHVVVKYTGKGGVQAEIFSAVVGRVTQVDRQELVKWLMQEVGSTAFIPQLGIIVVLPQAEFAKQVSEFDRVFRQLDVKTVYGEAVDVVDHELGVSYTPEIMHLFRTDRASLLSGWDLEGSRARVHGLYESVRDETIKARSDLGLNSDLITMLDKIISTARLVGVASILISIPILWMTWVFAWNWAGLIALNERRTIGLMRLRGAAGNAIGQGLVLAIGAGGLIGGVLGIVAGTAIPLIAYHFNGSGVPLNLIHKVQEPWSLILFVVISTVLGLFAGRRVTRYASRISPRVAAERIASSEAEAFSLSLTDFQFYALVLGSYKVVAWLVGYTPSAEPFHAIDAVLNFLGAPLFIYGFASLIISRPGIIRPLLSALTAPLGGNLRWFVVKDMMSRPHRIGSAALIASLMFCMSFYPRLVSDSFYDRTVRGVKVNAGSDLGVAIDASELTKGEIKVKAIKAHLAETQPEIDKLVGRLQEIGGVTKTQVMFDMTVPGVYMPGSEGLSFYLVPDPQGYLDTVYHEEQLSLGQPFGKAVGDLSPGGTTVLVSEGLANSKNWRSGSVVNLGNDVFGHPEQATISGVISVLPGAPRLLLQNRAAYVAAQVDFINQLARSDPFVVARVDNPRLENLDALLSRVVLLVNVAETENASAVAGKIEQVLQGSLVRQATIRKLQDEIGGLSKDMFVSLAIENIKVYMIGGALVALAGVLAVSLANFISIRRTFALLRVRGCSPVHLLKVSVSDSLVPLVLGMVVGILVGVFAGYGLTGQLLSISGTLSILQALRIHLIFSPTLFLGTLSLCLAFLMTAMGLSFWIFRKTAREQLQ